MKIKCPECGTGKARRVCWRRENAEICSACCAAIRDEDCAECVHYVATHQYEEKRRNSALGLTGNHFLMEVSPDVQEAVDAALETGQRGGFDIAMDTLIELLKDHPRHHDVPYGIGLVQALKGEYEESVAWFDRAIEIYPHSLEAHFNKAVSYQKLLDIPNCIRAYQNVATIGPASDPAVAKARSIIENMASTIRRTEGIGLDPYLRAGDRFNEAFELMNRGEWRRALKGFRASASLHDKSAPCHGNMGLCLAQLGEKAEALAELDRALEINPEYEPALNNRKVFEKMTEGQPMEDTKYESINYSMENFMKKRT